MRSEKIVVIGGILTIAIVDALSDAMGIHMATESLHKYSLKEIWEATYSTFTYKFIFSAFFILPVLLIELSKAIIICILIGSYIICANNLLMARQQKRVAWKLIINHLTLTFTVIIIAYYIGVFISIVFS